MKCRSLPTLATRARGLLAAALSFISCIGHASEEGETYLLTPGFINCFERSNLEKSLDQKSNKEIPKLAKQMYADGVCALFPQYQRVANLKLVTNGSVRYKCYQLWDVTRPLAPAATSNEACSSSDSVTTLKKVKMSRTGSYEVADRTKSIISANCREGGNVLLMKSGNRWIRKSSIPFGSPLKNQTSDVVVSENIGQMIKRGCKGDDY